MDRSDGSVGLARIDPLMDVVGLICSSTAPTSVAFKASTSIAKNPCFWRLECDGSVGLARIDMGVVPGFRQA